MGKTKVSGFDQLTKEANMLMSKGEVEKASRVWAANVEAPLTRDEQILLMTTARERCAANKQKILQLLKEQDHGTRTK